MMMPESNRLIFVGREHLCGLVGGVDFGSNLSCTNALLWSGGTSFWSSRGATSYGASTLYALTRASVNSARGHRRLGAEGGQLTIARITRVITEIEALFDEPDLLPWLVHAVARKQTLLIEGGGTPFAPSTRARHKAYPTR